MTARAHSSRCRVVGDKTEVAKSRQPPRIGQNPQRRWKTVALRTMSARCATGGSLRFVVLVKRHRPAEPPQVDPGQEGVVAEIGVLGAIAAGSPRRTRPVAARSGWTPRRTTTRTTASPAMPSTRRRSGCGRAACGRPGSWRRMDADRRRPRARGTRRLHSAMPGGLPSEQLLRRPRPGWETGRSPRPGRSARRRPLPGRPPRPTFRAAASGSGPSTGTSCSSTVVAGPGQRTGAGECQRLRVVHRHHDIEIGQRGTEPTVRAAVPAGDRAGRPRW